MHKVLREQVVKKARERHECNATLFAFAGMNLRELISTIKPTFSEAKVLIKANECPYIKKGEPYIKQISIDLDDGKFYVVKMRQDVHAICCKYELYFE